MTTIGTHQATQRLITLSADDRRRHLYVIGQTGVGKSTLLENLALRDIAEGKGIAFIDPHGQSAQKIADNIPVNRTEDVAYIEYDPENPFGLDVFDGVTPERKSLLIEHLVSSFRNLWISSWGANLEDLLRCSLYLLLDNPGTSLLDVLRLLSDSSYRRALLRNCTNPVVRDFWEKEFEDKSDKQKAEETRSTTNKVRQFFSNPHLCNIISQPSTINISHLMNEGKILILNLSKGSWGETPARLIGSLFIIAFAQAAEERATIPEENRRDFYLYVDEFQNFQNEGFGTILSESRKMRLSLTLANQFYAQLPESIQAAISGNVSTWVIFRVGAKDAQEMAKEIDHGNPKALSNTANFQAWVRVLEHGLPAGPYPIDAIPPYAVGLNRLAAVRNRSRARHTRPVNPT